MNKTATEKLIERVEYARTHPYGEHAQTISTDDIATTLDSGHSSRVGIWDRIIRGERGPSSLDIALLSELLEVSAQHLIHGNSEGEG